ncbi:Fimbrial protein [Klebsiella michiganensis]|nr:Fimbrial protein [Klebsiella michiganensis]
MRIVSFLFLLMAGIYSHSGWAETCRGDIGQMTVKRPEYQVPAHAALNTQMTGMMADNGSGFISPAIFRCRKRRQSVWFIGS